MITPSQGGVWSATPTPLTSDQRLDVSALPRLVEHHVRLGVTGLMLAGTCGEGPWLRLSDREKLARSVVEITAGRLKLAFQVTDNSPGRVLDHIEQAARWGINIVVVEAPYFLLAGSPMQKIRHYKEIAKHSTLPIGLYDRGAASPHSIPEANLLEVLADPKIVMLKDSSLSQSRRDVYLEARRLRPELVLLNGDEFNCVAYLRAGYNGLLLGGGVFNGLIARRIIDAVRDGRIDEAERLQARMSRLMQIVYGEKLECWLAGLKELLVQMGIFSTHAHLLGFPLTDACRAAIRAALANSDGQNFRPDLLPTKEVGDDHDRHDPRHGAVVPGQCLRRG